MPASHDHDDEGFDATDNGPVDVTPEEEAALAAAQQEYLTARGF